jgi:hypothetical protein
MTKYKTMQEHINNYAINGRRLLRTLFLLTAAYGGVIFWLAPHLPMADLPQHAAQVATLKSLIMGNSPWQDLFRINFFTPYLIGYTLWLPLTFLFSVTVAVKILLTIGYYFFIWTCIHLRKSFDGDDRLDWLFLPCYFGFAFKWGFLTFILAAPFGLLFILTAKLYADNPSIRTGAYLTIAGIFLFFCHGLVFFFAMTIGACFLLIRLWRDRRSVWIILPYICIFLLFVIFYFIKSAALPETLHNDFFHWRSYKERPEQFLLYMLGTGDDPIFLPIALFFIAYPFLLASHVKLQLHDRLVPFIVFLLVWFGWPSTANLSGMEVALIYQRFAIFSLPLYALLFQRKQETVQENSGISRTREMVVMSLVVLTCWTYFAMQSNRIAQFAKESEDFDKVIALAEPNQLMLYYILDGSSPASNNNEAYRHFPAWYQAEANGAVEFNFAIYQNLIVLYRSNEPSKLPYNRLNPFTTRWSVLKEEHFYYILVRHTDALPSDFFEGIGCQVNKIVESGTWSLYRGCSNAKSQP